MNNTADTSREAQFDTRANCITCGSEQLRVLSTGRYRDEPVHGFLTGDAYGMVPRAGSPAIDSGARVGGAIPAHDFLRRRRPEGAGVDRGAYEATR